MKAILLDLDGTLVDTEKLDDITMQKVLKTNGLLKSKKFIGYTLEEYVKAITKDKKFQNKIKNGFIKEYEKILEKTELKINHQLLKLLKRENDVKIALVTSNNKRLTSFILTKLGIKKFFDIIVTCEDVENQKPHPEPYLRAIKRLNINPKDCIAFEDSKQGMLSAKSAGIKIIKKLV